MKHIISCTEQYLLQKGVHFGSCAEDEYRIGLLKKKKLLNEKQANQWIVNSIRSGEPFCVGRFGAIELSMMKMMEFDVKSRREIMLRLLCSNAGFFPEDISAAGCFFSEMKSFCAQVDLLGVYWQPFEGYFIQHDMKPTLQLTLLESLEPWKCPQKPWSTALKGKKVLVVHPFEQTILSQYQKREKLFPNTEILPEFELKTLKAVQTIAGNYDPRFETWMDALNWMESEALKIDFDIAIIGCGAYGAPLAARLKKQGKQAIHLGGATQLLFGIMGKRWEQEHYRYVQHFVNEFWIRPNEKEVPNDAKKVEDGCYW